MSQEYDNTNRGALFKNDKTGGNPNWPDYSGNVNVDGREFWLDAWIKKDRGGKTYMSLSIKPKVAKGERTTQNEPAQKQTGDFDDDIPF